MSLYFTSLKSERMILLLQVGLHAFLLDFIRTQSRRGIKTDVFLGLYDSVIAAPQPVSVTLQSLSEPADQMTDICLRGTWRADLFAFVFQQTCCSYVNASLRPLNYKQSAQASISPAHKVPHPSPGIIFPSQTQNVQTQWPLACGQHIYRGKNSWMCQMFFF